MEPHNQVEVQLGHLCNNRCVFCVSGQLTAARQARQIPTEPVFLELDLARARGATRVTLLGGEPTIQRSFFDVLRHAKGLGFEEIVIFTNGVMTPRLDFVEQVHAIGDFTWRFSIQGATEACHDAVTKRPGSFRRILDGIALLRERGQRITANMCITHENLSSLPHYPELVAAHGVSQLHLDQIRPLDAGARSDEYLKEIMPRYSDQVPFLREMLSKFPPEFDVNIGNFPYCLIPEYAHRIHHDGQATVTVAATTDGLTAGFDKYAVKRADKTHPEACGGCVFRPECNGLFLQYQAFFGESEVCAVSPERLRKVATAPMPLARLLGAAFGALPGRAAPPPWTLTTVHTDDHSGTAALHFSGPARVTLELRSGTTPRPAPLLASAPLFSIGIASGLEQVGARAVELARWVAEALLPPSDWPHVSLVSADSLSQRQALLLRAHSLASAVAKAFGGQFAKTAHGARTSVAPSRGGCARAVELRVESGRLQCSLEGWDDASAHEQSLLRATLRGGDTRVSRGAHG